MEIPFKRAGGGCQEERAGLPVFCFWLFFFRETGAAPGGRINTVPEEFYREEQERVERMEVMSPLLGSEFLVERVKVWGRGMTGRECILRTPLSGAVSRLMAREILLLRELEGCFPFAIPRPLEMASPGMLYPRLDGRPAIELDGRGESCWNAEGRSAVFVDSLAAALVCIHACRRVAGERTGAEGDDLKQAFLRQVSQAAGREEVSGELIRQCREWAECTVWPAGGSFIHGDMHAGNILVDDRGGVSGVIDWTHAGWGDPCQDFVFHYFGFGGEGLNQLLESYGRQGGAVYPGMAEHVAGLWTAYPLRAARFACERNQ